jgi:hypothetical protein
MMAVDGRPQNIAFGTDTEGKDFGMVRLRNTLLAVMLAAGLMGCAHMGDYAHWSIFHCTECDDFPTPAYGPNGSMMPGSYTGPPAQNAPSAARMMIPPSSNAPAQNNEAIVNPPNERPITPTPPATATSPPAVPPAETP